MGRRAPLTGDPDVRAALVLAATPGLGSLGIHRLVREMGSPCAVLARPDRVRERIRGGGDPGLADPARGREADRILERCVELGIRVLAIGTPDYPKRLLEATPPPPVLYLRGRMELLEAPAVGIVGSRKATAPGRRTAERIARDLSRAGVAVVSGMALGIDAAAHRGALEGPGGTIAVLGRGPDRAYPVANGALFRQVSEEGLLVSEFPPGTVPRAHHFPRRNLILAALSSAVLVVEAGRRSGALNTVGHAGDMGRDVMAVPGCVEWEQAAGTNRLLRDGAGLVLNARDVLEGASIRRPLPEVGEQGSLLLAEEPRKSGGHGDDPGDRLVALLGERPLPLEELLPRSGLPVSRLLVGLTRLELEGRVLREADGWRVAS